MHIAQQHATEVDRIRGSMRCPKNFRCCESGFTEVGKVEVIAGGRLLECQETDAASCPLALSYGDAFFCKCPLRMYIARILHR
jgi:hypothetical protein